MKPLFCFLAGRPPSSSCARFGAMVRAVVCWCVANTMVVCRTDWRRRKVSGAGLGFRLGGSGGGRAAVGQGLCCHPSVTRLHPASLRANDGPVRRPGVAIWQFTRGHSVSCDPGRKKARPCLGQLFACSTGRGRRQPQELRASPFVRRHSRPAARWCSSASSSPERYVSSHAAAEPDTSCGVKHPLEASANLPVEPAHHLPAQRLPIAPAST